MNKNLGQILEYKFQPFAESEDQDTEVKAFEFKPLTKGNHELKREEFQKVIKSERTFAKENSFKVNPIVEKHRGLRDQEEYEYEQRVREEVEKRVRVIQEDAYKAGFEEGVNQGREEIFEEMRNVVDQKLESFSDMVHNVLKTQEELVTRQQKEVYVLIKNLTRWIILRELQGDGKYIERLLEKLLLDMQTRSNLLIQVNAQDFDHMPEVLTHIEKRLGELKNVRIEIDNQISTSGIIVESDNGILNATMEEQFKNLDKLFEDVILDS